MHLFFKPDEMPAASGVYRIEFPFTGDSYIGASRNMRRRVMWHAARLNCGKHPIQNMQSLFDNFDRTAIRFEVREEYAGDDLSERETNWIGLLKPTLNRAKAGGVVFTTSMNIPVTSSLKARLQEAADEECMTLTAFCRMLLTEMMEREEFKSRHQEESEPEPAAVGAAK